ncbi:MAG: T9SS type A sorting domain-containing protein [Syntrophothermus sp.]
MLKKLSTILIMVALYATVSMAQTWTFQGQFPDTSKKGGNHGIVVTPDNKVWVVSYYSSKWPTDTSISSTPITVYNPDGSLDQVIYTVTVGIDVDTLGKGGSTRGMDRDSVGNVYWIGTGPGRIVKIDYLTKQGLARHLSGLEHGSSPSGPAISNDGTVFVGPVVGGGTTAIYMYDTDLNPLGAAVVGPPNITRTFEVSPDGLTIYWTMFTGSQGMYIYHRNDVFSEFALTDSALLGMSIETADWQPGTGLLWVSNDSRGTDPSYTHLSWYGWNPTTKTIVDSFQLTGFDPTIPDEYPRGLAFTDDGNTAYVGLFGTAFGIYKFTKNGVGVREDHSAIVNNYTLDQNYPNPFNPSTTIKFSVVNEGMVTLRVFNMLGEVVSTLVNENLSNGNYTVNFDASKLSSGTYVYELQTGDVRLTKKMVLMK